MISALATIAALSLAQYPGPCQWQGTCFVCQGVAVGPPSCSIPLDAGPTPDSGSSSGGFPDGGWTVVFDVDLTNVGTVSLSTDGAHTVSYPDGGGFTATKVNSANDSIGMNIAPDAGLLCAPVSNTVYYNATRTSPLIDISFTSSIYPLISYTTPVRCEAYLAADNAAANYDQALFGIETTQGGGSGSSLWDAYQGLTSNTSGVVEGAQFQNGGANNAANGKSVSGANIIAFTVPSGLGTGYGVSGFANTWGGTWPPGLSQSWPLDSTNTPTAYVFIYESSFSAVSYAGLPSTWNLMLGCARNSSATALKVYFARIKCEAQLIH